jgi:hypothetical protein
MPELPCLDYERSKRLADYGIELAEPTWVWADTFQRQPFAAVVTGRLNRYLLVQPRDRATSEPEVIPHESAIPAPTVAEMLAALTERCDADGGIALDYDEGEWECSVSHPPLPGQGRLSWMVSGGRGTLMETLAAVLEQLP